MKTNLILLLLLAFFLSIIGERTVPPPAAGPDQLQNEPTTGTAVTPRPNSAGSSQPAWVQDAEYHIRGLDDNPRSHVAAYQAPNRAQRLRTYFAADGITVVPRVAGQTRWKLQLTLVQIGDGRTTYAVPPAQLIPDENRLTYRRGSIDEWYINSPRGLEQGFTIHEPPVSGSRLLLDLALDGDLLPILADDRQSIRFRQADGTGTLNYDTLIAFDANGRLLQSHMELTTLADGRTAVRLSVAAAGAAYPLIIDPTITDDPAWSAHIPQDADFGLAVSGAGDVNGDGFDDVVIGAPGFDGGEVDQGAAFLFTGSSSGLRLTPAIQLDGYETGAAFGFAVAGVGDVNRDGYDDLVVGAPGAADQSGAVFLFYGRPGGVNTIPGWQLQGNLNGSRLGEAVAGAGDVNNDNFADIIFSAPGEANFPRPGEVYVSYGSVNGPGNNPWTSQGNTPGDRFGSAVAGAGDVNGDMIDDILIGGEKVEADDTPTGAAVVFHGAASGLFLPASGPAIIANANWVYYGPPGSDYGHSVSSAGDVNGDNIADILVGAPLFDDGTGALNSSGLVDLFLGDFDGLPDVSPSLTLFGVQDGGIFGDDVNAAGDFDGDGIDDILVGATFTSELEHCDPGGNEIESAGVVYLFRGAGQSILETEPSHSFSGCQPFAQFGFAVSSAGDVNRDGHGDLLIGAPASVAETGWKGEAFAYYGFGPITGLTAGNDSPKQVAQPVEFTAFLETGGDSRFSWEFGDGGTGAGQVVRHIYDAPGVYTATVTVTNPSNTAGVQARTGVIITANRLIDPNSGGTFEYTDDSGRGLNVNVPGGAVTETVSLAYTPLVTITQQTPAGSIGYYFDLDLVMPLQIYLPQVSLDGGGTAVITPAPPAASQPESAAGTPCPPGHICFATPISVTVFYDETTLNGVDEEQLALLFWDPDGFYDGQPGWPDANRTCNAAAQTGEGYTYFPDENKFTLQICHLTRFGVVGVN